MLRIMDVKGMEVLDSRGNPTVMAKVILSDGTCESAAVPSGASTGKYEALELRDGDANRYQGKGVLKAVNNINAHMSKMLIGMDADVHAVDSAFADKTQFGANAVLAVSMALAKAIAKAKGLPLYEYLGERGSYLMPVPMMNILNGGAHADNMLDVQEFMIMPVGAPDFREALRYGVEIYHALKNILKEEGYSTAVGDEGGFAPELSDTNEAIEYIIKAIKRAGYEPGWDVVIALDAAASEWKGTKIGEYVLPKSGQHFTTEELIEYWKCLCERYPIVSIEDPLDEEDWEGFKKLTKVLGDRIQIVGDDLFVTNVSRLKNGIESNCGNSILIKPNQIGSLSESIEAVKVAQENGYNAVISHRSGETEDTTIADLAVALNAGQIKTGAPCRSERVAKYNRLLNIEQELGKRAKYTGKIILKCTN